MKKSINFVQKHPLTIISTLLAICIVLWGIAAYIDSKSSDDIAETYYDRASKSFNQKEYSAAQLFLDSIKIMSPGAFEWRHKANDFKLLIRKEEQTNTLKYIHQQLDTIATQQKQVLKEQYKNVQDKKYQDLAQYVWYPQYLQTQQTTKSGYLFQVDEQGQCYILTTYKGTTSEKIQSLTVTFKDGTNVTCQNEFGHQSNKIATGYTQTISFHGDDAYSIIEAMANENAQPSKMQITGNRSYTLPITHTDLSAAKKMAILSRLLVAKQGWLKQQKECVNELRFLDKRINKQEQKFEQQQEQTQEQPQDSTSVSEPI